MDFRLISLQGPLEVGNNTVHAKDVEMIESGILFRGENNVLFVEEGATLKNVKINFYGSNSVVYISKTKYNCRFQVNIYNDSSFYMGRNNSINGPRPAIFQLSEHKNIFIGDDNMFSLDVIVRLADPHLVYSSETFERVNDSKSVYIGDHVWIGQNVTILKGVKIGSGSIVAGSAILTKDVPSNASFGGNPAKLLKKNIFWLRPSVHMFNQADTDKWAKYEKDTFVYEDLQNIPFETMENKLNGLTNASEKFNYLHNLPHDKNRFFRAEKVVETKKSWKDWFRK